MFVGKLSWRRIKVLIAGLPNDSATSIAVHGNGITWDDTQELLACICDVLSQANWQRGGGKGQRPKPIKRPYEDKIKTPEDARNQARAKVEQDNDVLSQEEFDRIMFGV